MPNDVLAVYLTFPDEATAERLARALVERRLAACVNVLPGARSFYRWRGAVHAEAEVLAVAKTSTPRLDALIAAVRELHPFELPCVVAYPAAGGDGAYLDWVRAETSAAAAEEPLEP
jgi:periplasmic divalent cation tolerance protein